MQILNRHQMKEAEAAAVKAGSSYKILMENAGRAAAAGIENLYTGLSPSLLLLCGKGNNAGDGFVIGRLLAQKGWQVELVLLCGTELSPLAEENRIALPSSVKIKTIHTANFATKVLVDCVFGTGFRGDLPPQVQEAFQKCNAAKGLKVAIDLPSGLDCDTGHLSPGTFLAEHTFTFGAYKPGLLTPNGQKAGGKVQCLDIGI